MQLFERIEKKENEIFLIKKQLEFIFNNFRENISTFNGFGFNLWKFTEDDIKKIIKTEEPRIQVIKIKKNDNENIIIDFIFENEEFSWKVKYKDINF